MGGQLTSEQYWKWRYLISEMQRSKDKYKSAEMSYKNILLGIEIDKLKSQIFKDTALAKERLAIEESKNDYVEYKKFLENQLGFSLNNKVVNDITFEITDFDLEEEKSE